MALTIEFCRRSTNQLQKILTFYDERNDSDNCKVFLLDGIYRHLRYNTRKLTVLSIRSSARKPLKIYKRQ